MNQLSTHRPAAWTQPGRPTPSGPRHDAGRQDPGGAGTAATCYRRSCSYDRPAGFSLPSSRPTDPAPVAVPVGGDPVSPDPGPGSRGTGKIDGQAGMPAAGLASADPSPGWWTGDRHAPSRAGRRVNRPARHVPKGREDAEMTFGSLFAGVGGLDLGLTRAGLTCSWQVEIDPFCRSILARHWPDVRRHDDIRTFPPSDTEEWRVDLIAGGFPCQDISHAGKRVGIDGERSGLWSEYERIIRLLRPRYVLVENVPALLVRGMDRVLGELATLGFDAEWECIPAGALGAPYLRDRLFILAHAHGEHGRTGWQGRSPDPGDFQQTHGQEDGDAGRPGFPEPESQRAFRGPSCPIRLVDH
jgi:hypothetical protein